MPFTDRADAGRRLAQRLVHLRGGDNVALGLPRGGVPVAFEVALALEVPLDVIVVRKLGVPSQRELAMGAIGEGGVRIINNDINGALYEALGFSPVTVWRWETGRRRPRGDATRAYWTLLTQLERDRARAEGQAVSS